MRLCLRGRGRRRLGVDGGMIGGFGSSARISCFRPAPVVVSGSATSSWRSGIEAEKRTTIRSGSVSGSPAAYGERKGEAMF